MLPYARPSNDCKLDAFNNFLLFGLFCPSFLFICCIFSRTSAGSLPRAEGTSACGVDASGFRAAARPDRQRGCTRLSQDLLCYDDPFRKNKNFDFCATFLRLRTPFRPLRGGNGPLCVRFASFSGFNPRFDAPRQSAIAKKLQFRAYFCFWASGSAPCWCRGRGVPDAVPLWTVLGSALPTLLDIIRLPHLRALLSSSHRSASCTAVS